MRCVVGLLACSSFGTACKAVRLLRMFANTLNCVCDLSVSECRWGDGFGHRTQSPSSRGKLGGTTHSPAPNDASQLLQPTRGGQRGRAREGKWPTRKTELAQRVSPSGGPEKAEKNPMSLGRTLCALLLVAPAACFNIAAAAASRQLTAAASAAARHRPRCCRSRACFACPPCGHGG